MDRLEESDRLPGLRVRVDIASLERVDRGEHPPRGGLLQGVLEPHGALQGVVGSRGRLRHVLALGEHLRPAPLELVDHVPLGRDLARHLEGLVVEAERRLGAPHLGIQIAAAHETEDLLARAPQPRRDLAGGAQVRLGGREVVPVRGNGGEPDPHARHASVAADLQVAREGALEVLARFVPGTGFEMNDAEVGVGDREVGEIAEAGGDLHGAKHVPGRLAPVGKMPVQDAEIVVRSDDAVVVVQIPAEEM